MSKNRTPSQDIIITDQGLEVFKNFGNIADTRLLGRGLRVMFLSALADDFANHVWFDEFRKELATLYDFFDGMEDEYGSIGD